MARQGHSFHSLEQLQSAARFSGIRHITEGADWELLFAKPVVDNLSRLASQGLIFEAQFELSNLKASRQLASYASSLPNLTIVINHAGLVCEQDFTQWQSALELLAPYPNIYLKCSGWEMNDRQYKTSWLDKVITTSVHYFGPGRVMLAITKRLLREHYRVFNLDISPADIGEYIYCDVSKVREVERAINSVIEDAGRIDVLVSNAGIHLSANIEQTSEAELDQIFALNVKGAYAAIKSSLRQMKKTSQWRDYSNIVGSGAGW